MPVTQVRCEEQRAGVRRPGFLPHGEGQRAKRLSPWKRSSLFQNKLQPLRADRENPETANVSTSTTSTEP